VQIVAAVFRKWGELSADEKKPYPDCAAAAESEIQRETKAWKARQRMQDMLGRLPARTRKKKGHTGFRNQSRIEGKGRSRQ
jgi:hypothetical protein